MVGEKYPMENCSNIQPSKTQNSLQGDECSSEGKAGKKIMRFIFGELLFFVGKNFGHIFTKYLG